MTEIDGEHTSKLDLDVLKEVINESDMPIALYVGPEMKIRLANKAMLKAWGKGESVIGKPLIEAIPELESQPFLNLLQEVRATGFAYNATQDKVELMIDGKLQTFYYDFTYKPLKDLSGQVWGVLNTATNVTELVLSKQNLEETGRQLLEIKSHLENELEISKKLEKQKDDFIGVASHELKTPLTALKSSMQFLNRWAQKFTLPPNIVTIINLSNNSIQKLGYLVETLLSTTKINEGQLELHKTSFVVADMVNECCDHIRLVGTYKVIVKGDLKLKISADRSKLDQVVVNMVNNAIKYAPQSKEVIVFIETVGEMAKVSVTDQGTGIASEKLPHLFKRYYREDHLGVQYSGLGLGLFISSEIIKKHHGDIGVNSTLGEGSTFWFAVPIC